MNAKSVKYIRATEEMILKTKTGISNELQTAKEMFDVKLTILDEMWKMSSTENKAHTELS